MCYIYYFPIIIFLLLLILYLNYRTNVIGEEFYQSRIKNKKVNPKIYDVSHKYFPNLYEYEKQIVNIIPIGLMIPLMTNLKIFIEFLSLIIIIFIIRSILIHVTILPGHSKCKNSDYSIPIFGGCYDKIISGHTSVAFLASLILYKYKMIPINLFIFLNLSNSFLLLSTRAHYTIDVILGYLLTGFIFQNNVDLLNY